jgi:HSP20 family protein
MDYAIILVEEKTRSKEAKDMDIVKYRPNGMIELFNDTWSRFFDPFFDAVPSSTHRVPAIDVKESAEGYSLEAELPGITDKDIEVKLEGNMLTLSTKKEERKEEKKENYLLKERKSYSFTRSFVVPEDVNAEKISAEFKNGLLTLSLPKTEKAKPKTLEIKVK